MTNEFLTHPIVDTLENHSNQLNEILKMNDTITDKFNKHKNINHKDALTEKNLETMELVLYKCLHKVGQLAATRDGIQTELNNHYSNNYKNSPAIGKKLYLNHYAALYKPYDKLKDKIWKTLTIILEHKEQTFN